MTYIHYTTPSKVGQIAKEVINHKLTILDIVLKFQFDHTCFHGEEKRVQILEGKWNKMKEL